MMENTNITFMNCDITFTYYFRRSNQTGINFPDLIPKAVLVPFLDGLTAESRYIKKQLEFVIIPFDGEKTIIFYFFKHNTGVRFLDTIGQTSLKNIYDLGKFRADILKFLDLHGYPSTKPGEFQAVQVHEH